MKYKITHFLIVSIIVSFMWSGCDKVDQPMNITVETIKDITDTLFFTDSISVSERQVLLEEFTGHLCVNCPEASLEVHEWIEFYEHRLVAYGIHAGSLATPQPSGEYTGDFTNPDGDKIFGFYGLPPNPSATVNRAVYNNNQVFYFIGGGVENAVTAEFAKPSLVDLKLKNTYYPNLNTIVIDVVINFKEQVGSTYKLAVMIAEDHIVAPQKNNIEEIGPVPDWLDYEHRNVLRDAVSADVFGIDFSEGGTIVAGEEYSQRFNYIPDDAWVLSNCNIIAYVTDAVTEEVLQVAELAVKTEK